MGIHYTFKLNQSLHLYNSGDNLIKKRCILCKNEKFQLISKKTRDSKKHKIIRCLKCNHIQLFPIPTLIDEKKFYDENLQDKSINDIGSIKRARRKMMYDNIRRYQFIQKIISKKSRVLENGSGHGFFLEIMKTNGFDIIGYDISKEKRKYSKKITDVPVYDININEKIPADNKFDIVVLFHTLEHITEPITLLKNIKKLLKPKGKILIEVPNSDDFHLKLNKFYKEFYWERAHIHYFNPKILKNVIQKSSFKNIRIVGVQRYGIENFFHWKLKNKPQMENPSYSLPIELNWVEKNYKNFLVDKLICDTIMVVANI